LAAKLAQCLEVLLQVFCGEMRRNLAEPEQLPELPKGQPRQLIGLADGQPALFIEVDGELDEHLLDR
jgi:hypothetical protein